MGRDSSIPIALLGRVILKQIAIVGWAILHRTAETPWVLCGATIGANSVRSQSPGHHS